MVLTIEKLDDRCPNLMVKTSGDYDYASYTCGINTKPCIRENGHTCEIYEEWLNERAD